MVKTLCALVLLLIGQSTFSTPIDLSDFSGASESVLSSTEEPEKIGEGSEIKFTAGFLKDLHRIKVVPEVDFSFYCESFPPTQDISKETWELIPNLTTAKILYPFHSFP